MNDGEQSGRPARRGAPRPSRRPEEDQPGEDYVERLERLGPRRGESTIAHRKRMAAVVEGRRLWILTWIKHGGRQEDCARALGVPRNNIAYELKQVGLSAELLRRMPPALQRELERPMAPGSDTEQIAPAPVDGYLELMERLHGAFKADISRELEATAHIPLAAQTFGRLQSHCRKRGLEISEFIDRVVRVVLDEILRDKGAPTPQAMRQGDYDAAIADWVALVLAVSYQTQLPPTSLLLHRGRSSKALSDARRLLAWAFATVSGLERPLAVAWLEQCMALGSRSIADKLAGDSPDDLERVTALWTRLRDCLRPDDVCEAVAAGVLGRGRDRARVWPVELMQRLGLEADFYARVRQLAPAGAEHLPPAETLEVTYRSADGFLRSWTGTREEAKAISQGAVGVNKVLPAWRTAEFPLLREALTRALEEGAD